MAFLKRLIEITIKLKSPATFGEGLGDTMTLSGHRAGVYIAQAGGDAQGVLQCQIFGLPLDKMNQLTAIAGVSPTENLGNTIQIAVGTEDDLHLAFTGIITSSWANLTNQPDAVLNIISTAAQSAAIEAVGAISYKGDADIKDILSDIAKNAGFTFENKQNVSIILRNVYLPGSNLDKIKSICKAARISYTIENNVLAIWPQEGTRDSEDIFLISPQTGLVGYPTYSSNGILLMCIYNPLIKIGNKIKIESQLTPTEGIWSANNIIHSLESENPNGNGPWFTTINCTRLNK
jgi:hypothetical protein